MMMKKFKLLITLVTIVGCASFFSGCTQQNVEISEGILQLHITDKPADLNITSAIVNISTIQVHKAQNNTEDGDDNESGWYTIVNKSQTFDLIALQNVTQLLGEKNLTAGKYTQIRLTIEVANITINNSGVIETHNLTIPSGTIKLIKGFWIIENETTNLTLDFNIFESIRKTGNDTYIFQPTIKVIEG